MLLLDLHPRWIGDGAGRPGAGISFECPGACCAEAFMKERVAVLFSNPIHGGDAAEATQYWRRFGETFEALTLMPAIDAAVSGHCRFWVREGRVFVGGAAPP